MKELALALEPILLVLTGALITLVGMIVVERWRLRHAQELARNELNQASRLADQELSHALRMAAMERRLVSLQGTYTLWHRLMTNLQSDEAWNIAQECQQFWELNCLFLPAKVRRQFKWFFVTAADYNAIVGPTGEASKTFDEMNSVGQLIADAAKLPSIGDLEFNALPTNLTGQRD